MASRTFEYKVYGTNGETPRQHAVSQMNATREAQNKLAQSGGADKVVVPQFSSKSAGPVDNNENITRLAKAQLKLDNTAKLQANTGQKVGGTRRNKRNRNRKSKHRIRIAQINFS